LVKIEAKISPASCLVACGVLDILLFSTTFATSPGGILLLGYYL